MKRSSLVFAIVLALGFSSACDKFGGGTAPSPVPIPVTDGPYKSGPGTVTILVDTNKWATYPLPAGCFELEPLAFQPNRGVGLGTLADMAPMGWQWRASVCAEAPVINQRYGITWWAANADGSIIPVGSYTGGVDLNPGQSATHYLSGLELWPFFKAQTPAAGMPYFVWKVRIGGTIDLPPLPPIPTGW